MPIAQRLVRFTPRPGRVVPRPGPRRIGVPAILALAALAAGCGDTLVPTGGGTMADRTPPNVQLVAVAPPSASAIAFHVAATDNLGLLTVHVGVAAPGISGVFDTTFKGIIKSVTLPYVVAVTKGARATVTAYAIDGAGNVGRPDTVTIVAGSLTVGSVNAGSGLWPAGSGLWPAESGLRPAGSGLAACGKRPGGLREPTVREAGLTACGKRPDGLPAAT